jgi:hypothetical protein
VEGLVWVESLTAKFTMHCIRMTWSGFWEVDNGTFSFTEKRASPWSLLSFATCHESLFETLGNLDDLLSRYGSADCIYLGIYKLLRISFIVFFFSLQALLCRFVDQPFLQKVVSLLCSFSMEGKGKQRKKVVCDGNRAEGLRRASFGVFCTPRIKVLVRGDWQTNQFFFLYWNIFSFFPFALPLWCDFVLVYTMSISLSCFFDVFMYLYTTLLFP